MVKKICFFCEHSFYEEDTFYCGLKRVPVSENQNGCEKFKAERLEALPKMLKEEEVCRTGGDCL